MLAIGWKELWQQLGRIRHIQLLCLAIREYDLAHDCGSKLVGGEESGWSLMMRGRIGGGSEYGLQAIITWV